MCSGCLTPAGALVKWSAKLGEPWGWLVKICIFYLICFSFYMHIYMNSEIITKFPTAETFKFLFKMDNDASTRSLSYSQMCAPCSIVSFIDNWKPSLYCYYFVFFNALLTNVIISAPHQTIYLMWTMEQLTLLYTSEYSKDSTHSWPITKRSIAACNRMGQRPKPLHCSWSGTTPCFQTTD